MSQRALIVIDLQNDYFPGGSWTLDKIEAVAANAQRLIGHFRGTGEKIFHIQHHAARPDAPFFAPGTPGADFHPGFEPQAGEEHVLKRQVNAFCETDLKERLDAAGIQDLVICGAMSHMCVDGTTRAGKELGYNCTVIHDACASKDLTYDGQTVPAAQAHGAFMAALAQAFAALSSTDDFLAGKR